MKKTITIMAIIFSACFIGLASQSTAQELILCLNQADNYVVQETSVENCKEHERAVKLERSDLAEKRNMTPLAEYTSSNECKGEGTTTTIGFDENDNGALEANEIIMSSSSCSPLFAEDTEPIE
jgi:hypothetical protein